MAIAKNAKGINLVGYLIMVSDTCMHWQDKENLVGENKQLKIFLAK